jgi:DNA repair exonuclease SbcCD nuclease subunit
MGKIAIVTDTHFGFKNDSAQFLDHFAKFYDNVFFPTLRENGVKTIMHLGDIVDRRKYMSYTTLRRFHEMFLDKTDEFEVTVLVGNHDVPYRNTNEINALSEIFRQPRSGLRIVSEPVEEKIGSSNVLLMPWINSSNYNECMRAMRDSRAQVLFGHLEIKGFEMYRGQPSHEGFDRSVFDKFDIVCSGHFHRKSTDRNINYLGAPYELTWADYDDPRGFHFFDTEARELTFVRNPYSIYKKVWYTDKDRELSQVLDFDFASLSETNVKVIVTDKTNPYWFEKYIEQVNQSGAYSVQVVDDHKNLDSELSEDEVLDAEDTFSVITKYVQGLETDEDSKAELQAILRNLYIAAQNMEPTD